ncbi:MAG: hypothetical protein HND52_15395 [Ignavibacteriae bacterium]|jgi:hypothetical protein|nr:hypothetical protein [Ignavibacteriota bacterium]NOG99340.1 hypothetical protein [Ignavibacteriota bacterium]
MKLLKYFPILLVLIIAANCTVFNVTPVNFAWPIESVYEVDSTGIIQEPRYAFEFNALPLFIEEDSLSMTESRNLRIIRDEKGYYFITAERFNHVFVFSSGESSFILENKILIDENGINSPAFNQRAPLIELIYNENQSLFLSNNGIVENKEEE